MRVLKLIGECVLAVGAVLCLFVGLAAWAQPSGVPTTDDQALNVFGALWGFIVEKKYAAAIGPGLTLAVWALRKWDQDIPKIGPKISEFLDKPLVSFLLPTVLAAVGGFATSLATGHSFMDALGAVYAAASSAITTYIGIKKLGEQMNAGKAAADAVVTKADAIAELKKE